METTLLEEISMWFLVGAIMVRLILDLILPKYDNIGLTEDIVGIIKKTKEKRIMYILQYLSEIAIIAMSAAIIPILIVHDSLLFAIFYILIIKHEVEDMQRSFNITRNLKQEIQYYESEYGNKTE